MQDPADSQAENRRRLLAGFTAAVAEKGYAATTIADIVRHARTSKRTFYQHFTDKQSCLLAAYGDATAYIRAAMRAAFERVDPRDWRAQLEAVIDAYVTALESTPALIRACLIEMAAAGPQARALRREVHEAFATLIRAFVEQSRTRHPQLRSISAPLATAIVAGIDELLLAQVEREPQHRLANLRETASELLLAVLTAPAK